ncbi:MAG: cytochrome b [Thiotrichaceae bacterium]|nr:cytochrome b [Thiotrichaceae bacterium]
MIETSVQKYGYLSIILHWSLAVALIGLYLSGDYMVGLDYYDSWYHRAPELHKAIGIVIGFFMLFRFIWNKTKTDLLVLTQQGLVSFLAYLAHHLFYLLVLLLVLTGFLFTTAKGQGNDVFGLFTVPALLPENTELAELSGKLHELLSLGFMLLFMIHTLAALYHHFIIKDNSLKLMLGQKNYNQNQNQNQIKGNSK